jgi:CheY-like chemotaxis protein
LAESDDVLRASLAEQLEQEGYDVMAASNSQEASAAAREPLSFAIIGLGEQLAADLREQGLTCPPAASDRRRQRRDAGKPDPAVPDLRRCLARLHCPQHSSCSGRRRGRAHRALYLHPSAKLLQADGRKVRLTEKRNQYPQVPSRKFRNRAARYPAA